MPTRNTQLIKATLGRIKVVDAEDAMAVLDFIAQITPQIRRVYASQSTTVSLLRNRQRELTGKLDTLAYEEDLNAPTSVEEIKMREDAKELETDDAQYDEQEALDMLRAVQSPIRSKTADEDAQTEKAKEIIKENKAKKTKK